MLINHRLWLVLFLCAVLVPAAGCRSTGMADRPDAPAGVAIDDSAEIDEPAESRVTAPASRIRAARDLNRRAARLIDDQQPDAAIDLLERAIAIDPANGEAYYYLSRAWEMKGDLDQAVEFIRLADMYTDTDDDWQQKILEQKALIRNEE